ncbi:MAG: hypothetical protein JSR82_09680 [Verrucomicrobia bacterium]|nr:hypothetical protein [Verrucomicrobiota bacterium]
MLRTLSLSLLLSTTLLAADPLAAPLQAHGGLEHWRKFRQLTYDLRWSGGPMPLEDRQLFDLVTRAGRIQCERYALGGSFVDGVWVMPNEQAVGSMPARFYLWTPFYFFSLPFVFADPGAMPKSQGVKSVGGVEYEVVEVRFKASAGDAPDDTYVAYFERPSGRLKMVCYTVSYFDGGESARQGKARQNAIVYEEWHEVQGLVVPKKATFRDWKDGQPGSAQRGTLEFSQVRFSETAPTPGNFEKPAGAVLASGPKK